MADLEAGYMLPGFNLVHVSLVHLSEAKEANLPSRRVCGFSSEKKINILLPSVF